jgi:phage tail protein X
MADDLIFARQGDTLDALAWRERGLGASDLGPLFGLNRSVADLGAILPLGTAIRVPAAPATPAPLVRDVVTLWD